MRGPLHKIPVVGIVVMAVIFGWIAFRLDWQRTATILSSLDGHFITAAIAFFLLQLVFLACRWYVLVNINHHYIKRVRAARIFYFANVTNFVFLSSLSGMLVRFLLSTRAGSPWVNAFCASIADRLFSFGTLIVFAILTLPTTFARLGRIDVSRSFAELIGVMMILGLGFLVYIIIYPARMKKIVGARRFRAGRAYLLRLLRSPALGLALLYSVAAQASFFLGVYFILWASHIHISFVDMMTVLPVVAVLASLPLTVGGWGLREGVYVVGLGLLGVSLENAFLASVQVGVFTMASALLIAIPVLMNRRFYIDLRRSAHAHDTVRSFLSTSP